jgi:glutathione S-transferase
MKLFFSPNACSRVVHIALEDAGADVKLVLTDTRAGGQHDPAFRALNPKGRVPVLATDRGVLTEVLAILGYVAQAYPQARLAPLDDPFAFAEMQALNSFLASSVHVTYAHIFRAARYAEDPVAHPSIKATALEALDAHLRYLDGRMKGPWAMGDAYTVADPYLFVMTDWLARDGAGDETRYANLHDYAKRMRDRRAVRKVIAVEDRYRRG